MSAPDTIAFFGSDAICLPVLDFLHQGARDRATLGTVISQPDRPSGRGRRLKPNPVAAWAAEKGVALRQPEKPGRAIAEELRADGVRLGLVMAYGHFLPRYLREAPTLGLVNFHASILPQYRGASPIESALATGDTSTGVSLMRVVREMDAGAVADVERVAIGSRDTAVDLRGRLAEACVPLLDRNLSALLAGSLPFREQDAAAATYCRKIIKEDGWLDFRQEAAKLDCRVRALTPWPGSFFEHRSCRIKVGAAEAVSATPTAPAGTVLDVGEAVDVACGLGTLRLKELQRPGGRMLAAGTFLRGYTIRAGDTLLGRETEPLVRRGAAH